jgi:hypothetical protein
VVKFSSKPHYTEDPITEEAKGSAKAQYCEGCHVHPAQWNLTMKSYPKKPILDTKIEGDEFYLYVDIERAAVVRGHSMFLKQPKQTFISLIS